MSKIKVNNKSYPLKYGYGALRLLGSMWNCNGIQAIVQEFQSIFPENAESEDISFEQADKLGDLALAGIVVKDDEELPARNDVIDSILIQDATQIEAIMTAFTDSFPKEKKGNPQPRSKRGKK